MEQEFDLRLVKRLERARDQAFRGSVQSGGLSLWTA